MPAAEAPVAPAATAPAAASTSVPEMPARPGAPVRQPMRGDRVTKIAQGLEKMGTQPTPEPDERLVLAVQEQAA